MPFLVLNPKKWVLLPLRRWTVKIQQGFHFSISTTLMAGYDSSERLQNPPAICAFDPNPTGDHHQCLTFEARFPKLIFWTCSTDVWLIQESVRNRLIVEITLDWKYFNLRNRKNYRCPCDIFPTVGDRWCCVMCVYVCGCTICRTFCRGRGISMSSLWWTMHQNYFGIFPWQHVSRTIFSSTRVP